MRRLAPLLFLLAALPMWTTPARAADDFCAYGRGTAVLLVDRTTRFDDTDRSVFLDALTGVVERLGPGDRLVAYTMGSAYTESRKIFDRCKPGCPDEGFFAGLVATCRPVLARAQYRGFLGELAATLATLLRDHEDARASDLFRTVAEATRTGSLGHPLRVLILFSDLLENSSILPERETRRLSSTDILRRLGAAGVSAGVQGAEVRVFGFGRDDAPGRPPLPQDQRRRIEETWRRWFLAGGAATVDIGFR